ncbi:phage repressor protein C with HTH and peptisase S24 domain [Bosea sp. BK604]|nr:phage repressor protein C with HTH and peptisase S24 domain [Bosea sp. BK604]
MHLNLRLSQFLSQVKFAIFAMDNFASFAKSPAMTDDPQRALKLWLAEKVAPHGTISRLAAATGISNDKITRSKELEASDPKKRRQLPLAEIRLIARFFGELPPGFQEMSSWLDDAAQVLPPADAGPRLPLSPQPQRGGQPDLSVRGIALGGKEGDGDFHLNGEALDFMARPAGLLGRPKAYAIILRNSSMEPVYRHGWPVFVDEDGRKPVEGEDVLIELYGEDEHEPGPAFIKTLVRRRGGQVILSQYNPPPEELRFDASRVRQMLRVIPYVEAMGLSV